MGERRADWRASTGDLGASKGGSSFPIDEGDFTYVVNVVSRHSGQVAASDICFAEGDNNLRRRPSVPA